MLIMPTAVLLRGSSQHKQPPTLPSVLATLIDWPTKLNYKAVKLAVSCQCLLATLNLSEIPAVIYVLT